MGLIICGSSYLDDLSSVATEHSRRYLIEEMIALYQLGHLDTDKGEKPLYPQIRFIDVKGDEVLVLKNGKLEEKLGTRGNSDWFKKAIAQKIGSSYITRIEIAQNTGEPEIRIAYRPISTIRSKASHHRLNLTRHVRRPYLWQDRLPVYHR
jgi:hypothetical protein